MNKREQIMFLTGEEVWARRKLFLEMQDRPVRRLELTPANAAHYFDGVLNGWDKEWLRRIGISVKNSE